MATVKVQLKWNKQEFKDVAVNLGEPASVFKAQIFALTGVPPDRQKVMGVKGGTLRDDADMSTVGIKEGSKLMLIGTADEMVAAPSKPTVFLEDLTDDQAAALSVTYRPGLGNLGNTCYLNSTIQCLTAMPELRTTLGRVSGGGQDQNSVVTRSMRDLTRQLGSTSAAVQPLAFVHTFRQAFPRFGETDSQMRFKQQDAQEAWVELLNALRGALPHETVQALLTGETTCTMKCDEAPEETAVVTREIFTQLSCNITVETNFLYYGLKDSLNEKLEKNSPSLGRSAVYSKKSLISRLPAYLTVQFVRFFWKPKEAVKAKILRNVKFPIDLDVYDLCTEELKLQLAPGRAAMAAAADAAASAAMSSGPTPMETTSTASGSAAAASGPTPMDTTPVESAAAPKEERLSASAAAVSGVQPGENAALINARKKKGKAAAEEAKGFTEWDTTTIPEGGYNNTGLYELCAVLTHQGRTADSGHYVGWVRQAGDLWLKYDDATVTETTTEEVLKLSGGGDWHIAYILLYRAIRQ